MTTSSVVNPQHFMQQLQRQQDPAGNPSMGGGINSRISRDERLTGLLVKGGQISRHQGQLDYQELGGISADAADGDRSEARAALNHANTNPVGFNVALSELENSTAQDSFHLSPDAAEEFGT